VRFLTLSFILTFPALGLDLGAWAEHKPHAIETGLAALKTVARGKSVLEGLEKLQKAEKLKFESTSSRAAREAGAGSQHGGGFYVDTIYLDENVPFVAFVATLVHEGTHALEFLAEEGGAEKLKNVTAEVRLHAEHRAYRAQDTFLAELIALDKKMEEVIEEAVAYRYLVAYPITEKIFRSFFESLPPSTVDAYLNRNPYDRLH